ncbi:MAG: hypothetical protein FWC26_15245 [Fibromonadales bacterium]|nr:hypothetical protein [Fibromonadales bacterium]
MNLIYQNMFLQKPMVEANLVSKNFTRKSLWLAIALIFFACSNDDSGGNKKDNDYVDKEKEKALYCSGYTFRDKVCCNKIDGIKIIDTQDCRNLGGQIKEAISTSHDVNIANLCPYYFTRNDDGCNTTSDCLVGSECTSYVRSEHCKAYGGTVIPSEDCSGYRSGSTIIVHCNSSFGCEPNNQNWCIDVGGKKVSVCKGYENYTYCIRASGFCDYLDRSSCITLKGTPVSTSCFN